MTMPLSVVVGHYDHNLLCIGEKKVFVWKVATIYGAMKRMEPIV
jgi:hypothetical protein